MNCFPDTSFLCSVYRTQAHSAEADTIMANLGGPLSVSSLLLLEFRQSTRLQARLHAQDKSKGFSANEAIHMLRDLETDLRSGVLQVEPVDWARVHELAESLSAKHTQSGGHRLADILHVATAMHLGKSTFLTFDANQRKLAKAEGMTLAA